MQQNFCSRKERGEEDPPPPRRWVDPLSPPRGPIKRPPLEPGHHYVSLNLGYRDLGGSRDPRSTIHVHRRGLGLFECATTERGLDTIGRWETTRSWSIPWHLDRWRISNNPPAHGFSLRLGITKGSPLSSILQRTKKARPLPARMKQVRARCLPSSGSRPDPPPAARRSRTTEESYRIAGMQRLRVAHTGGCAAGSWRRGGRS